MHHTLDLSWPRTWFQRFRVPNMFRTSCSEHVPNMFRTSRIAICTQKNLTGCPSDLKYEKSDIFENCLHFSFWKNRILRIAISTISMRPKIQTPIIHENLGACSEHLVRNSVLCQLSIILYQCGAEVANLEARMGWIQLELPS